MLAQFHARSLVRPLLCGFAALFASCAGDGGASGMPSFEEFRRQHYESSLDSYIIEHDMEVSESELKAYYERRVKAAEEPQEGDPLQLVVRFENGRSVIWPSNLSANLTWCIDKKSFGDAYEKMRETMYTAGENWSRHSQYQVNFYPKGDDEHCGPESDVVFHVARRTFKDKNTLAAARARPYEPSSERHVYVSPGAEGHVAALTHELGHVLGFRHENNRNTQDLPSRDDCAGWEDSNWAAVTKADSNSIMNCSVAVGDVMSDQDILGMQCLYPNASDVQRLLPLCMPEGLYYRAHLSQFGWLGHVMDNDIAGAVDENYAHALEAIQVGAVTSKGVDVCVTVHVAQKGWLPEVCGNGIAGTTGEGLAIEALSMRVKSGPPGCSISYTINSAERSWQKVERDGTVQGNTGLGEHVMAVRAQLSPNCF